MVGDGGGVFSFLTCEAHWFCVTWTDLWIDPAGTAETVWTNQRGETLLWITSKHWRPVCFIWLILSWCLFSQQHLRRRRSRGGNSGRRSVSRSSASNWSPPPLTPHLLWDSLLLLSVWEAPRPLITKPDRPHWGQVYPSCAAGLSLLLILTSLSVYGIFSSFVPQET